MKSSNERIFIIGCPRSGTTILMDILSSHKNLSWVSQFRNRIPKYGKVSYLDLLYKTPFIGEKWFKDRSLRNKKIFPHPVEPWGFWNYYVEKFQLPRGGGIIPRDRGPRDVTDEEAIATRRAVDNICKIHSKPHFLSKYTDFSRIKMMDKIFNEPKFVYLKRNPKAVVKSYLSKIKKGRFKTWNERKWWAEGWPKKWKKRWINKYDKSKISFLCYMWKMFTKSIEKNLTKINSKRYVKIEYERLTSNTKSTVKKIVKNIPLEESTRVVRFINENKIDNRNYKYRRLKKEQIKLIEEITIK